MSPGFLSDPDAHPVTRVLLAYSDTGGGHRAAATALQEALYRAVSDATCHVTSHAPGAPLQVSLVDPYALSARWPFDRLSACYPVVVNRASWLWQRGFRLTDRASLTATLQSLAWPALSPVFRTIRQTQSPDVIVSTHPLLTAPLRRTFPHTPLMVVVTDLMTGHISWYDRRAQAIVVPTEAARARAIANGVRAEAIAVLGVPVAASFLGRHESAERLRERLGWSAARPTVLLVGGGDGVGPLESVASAVDRAGLGCDLAVVTGRNVALLERLRARDWRGYVHLYGYVDNMGELMRAAAALLTKAGPGTISEACVAACPMVLYGAIPGQETGNIRFVETGGAGVWAPDPALVVAALRCWLQGGGADARREAAAAAARKLARPQAAAEIAARILQMAGQRAVLSHGARRV